MRDYLIYKLKHPKVLLYTIPKDALDAVSWTRETTIICEAPEARHLKLIGFQKAADALQHIMNKKQGQAMIASAMWHARNSLRITIPRNLVIKAEWQGDRYILLTKTGENELSLKEGPEIGNTK